MSSAQGQRIQANCRIIWGDRDYDPDIETDDWLNWSCIVKQELPLGPGPPLTMAGLCPSQELAWQELDRMLHVWAKQVQSGQPMTKAQSLEIFGGFKGRSKVTLGKFIDKVEKMELNKKQSKGKLA